MKVLFCNITYMSKYIGITEDDMPYKGGSWVQKNKDAHEQWNFLNVNGTCYGFVMNHGDKFNINRIDENAGNSDAVEGVTVVWCALNSKNETVIVGWYENATVYRHYIEALAVPNIGIERIFFTEAKAEDCYLLPENLRTFTIGRASRDGKGKGFGQENYWFADSSYAKNELIPSVLEFLEKHKSERINRLKADFECATDYVEPLTEEENQLAEQYLDENEYYKYLPYGYRKFYHTNDADTAYYIADALRSLHQYDMAAEWYIKVTEIEGDSWGTNGNLPYLYQQAGRFQESMDAALELIKYPEAEDIDILNEIYSIIADDCFYLRKLKEAIMWLDKIIAQSEDEEYIAHTKFVKENWLELMKLS